jgi:hypothetical protein
MQHHNNMRIPKQNLFEVRFPITNTNRETRETGEDKSETQKLIQTFILAIKKCESLPDVIETIQQDERLKSQTKETQLT